MSIHYIYFYINSYIKDHKFYYLVSTARYSMFMIVVEHRIGHKIYYVLKRKDYVKDKKK